MNITVGDHVFELVPVGYEFTSAEDGHDRNWLRIRVKASAAEHHWGGTDACMLTWELRSLCSWLKAHASEPPQADDSLEFLEPELVFAILARGRDSLALRVTMRNGLS